MVEIVAFFNTCFDFPKGTVNVDSPRYRTSPMTSRGMWPSSLHGVTARVWTNKGGWVHREEGPAVEMENGGKIWMRHGVLLADPNMP